MKGFWISPAFKITEILDHLMDVADHPIRYGISLKKWNAMSAKGYSREAILIEVLKNGWVRVRGHGDYTTFEGWGKNDDIISTALVFAKHQQLWNNEVIVINNLKSGRAIDLTMGELRNRYGVRRNPIKFPNRISIR